MRAQSYKRKGEMQNECCGTGLELEVMYEFMFLLYIQIDSEINTDAGLIYYKYFQTVCLKDLEVMTPQ